MSATVYNEKELAEAIKKQEEYIEIFGDFANKVVKIKATGKIAWAICGTALAAAIYLYVSTPAATVATAPAGGTGGVVSFGSATAATAVAATTLGSSVTAAVAIGIAAGGIGAVNSLRNKYKIVDKKDRYVKIQRK